MTKTEIAKTLSEQYAEIETEMYIACDVRLKAKTEYELLKDEHTENNLEWARKEVKMLRAKMATIEQTKTMLGINSKQWFEAIKKTYIENSIASKSI